MNQRTAKPPCIYCGQPQEGPVRGIGWYCVNEACKPAPLIEPRTAKPDLDEVYSWLVAEAGSREPYASQMLMAAANVLALGFQPADETAASLERLQRLIDSGWVLRVRKDGWGLRRYLAQIDNPDPNPPLDVDCGHAHNGPTVADALSALERFVPAEASAEMHGSTCAVHRAPGLKCTCPGGPAETT